MFIRTFKYLHYNKKRTLSLFLVLFVIGNLILSSFAIKSATNEASRLAKEKLGTKVTLRINMDLFKSGSRMSQENLPQLTTDDANQLITSSYVNYYNYYNQTNGTLLNLNPVIYEVEDETDSSSKNSNNITTDVKIIGTMDLSVVDTFAKGQYELIEGTNFTIDQINNGEKIVMVSKDFAEFNNLTVGDVISMNPIDRYSIDLPISDLTIGGIYEIISRVSDDVLTDNPSLLEENLMYIPYTALNSMMGKDEKNINYAEYYLKDPNEIEAFKQEAEGTEIDFETFFLDSGELEYAELVGPIENVANTSNMTIILTFVGGALILLLIIMMSIRERKYEIGVLMALGKAKVSIIGQFLLEILLIGILAFSFSILSGKVVATQISDYLLQKEVSIATTTQFSGRGSGRNRLIPTTSVDPIDDIHVEITLDEIGLLLITGFGICMISIIIPAQKILRQNPRQILTELGS